MTEIDHVAASDANGPDNTATATLATPSRGPGLFDATTDSVATITATADSLEYTVTVGQALERFHIAGRKTPSERTIQRYCIEGRLAAQKIRTTYGSEWLINDASLTHLIDAEPIVIGGDSVAGDAKAPTPGGDTDDKPHTQSTATYDNGDASGDNFLAAAEAPRSERRSLGEVLIENARLLEAVEGRNAIIVELREDKAFLREEVREARKTRDDVKNIAERMLDTLKTIAVGRTALPPEIIRPTIIVPEEPQPDQGSG